MKKIDKDLLDSTVTNKPFFETIANILLSENVMLELKKFLNIINMIR